MLDMVRAYQRTHDKVKQYVAQLNSEGTLPSDTGGVSMTQDLVYGALH